MKTLDIFDLYADYLITSISYTTATGLSGLVDNASGHDQVTRFLSQQDCTSKKLCKGIKKNTREIETDEGVLIVDDTIQEKSHSKLIALRKDDKANGRYTRIDSIQ
ncbi:MAG: hypothetical protein RQ733_00005, partial [Methyloprofundus sp.]|nr:hypothetical protein [Methyloprofundus sp.]